MTSATAQVATNATAGQQERRPAGEQDIHAVEIPQAGRKTTRINGTLSEDGTLIVIGKHWVSRKNEVARKWEEGGQWGILNGMWVVIPKKRVAEAKRQRDENADPNGVTGNDPLYSLLNPVVEASQPAPAGLLRSLRQNSPEAPSTESSESSDAMPVGLLDSLVRTEELGSSNSQETVSPAAPAGLLRALDSGGHRASGKTGALVSKSQTQTTNANAPNARTVPTKKLTTPPPTGLLRALKRSEKDDD